MKFSQPWLPGTIAGAVVAAGVGGVAGVLLAAPERAGWIEVLFRYPGALIIVALNLAAFVLSSAARRQFAAGEPLRSFWTLALIAATCNLSGAVLGLVLAPLPFAPELLAKSWSRLATLVGGPLQAIFLLAAFWVALRLYRQTGMLVRPRRRDWALGGAAAVLGVWEFCWTRDGTALLTALMLSVLVVEALLVWRSAKRMGNGLIPRCWAAFAYGILLTIANVFAVWLAGSFLIPVPLGATSWYLSVVASVCYTLAPAYQLEACRRAVAPRDPQRTPAHGRFSPAT